MEASTGDVRLRARGREAAPDRLDHEADDRAAHDGAARSSPTRSPASDYIAAPIESQARPAPGRAAVGRRPAARPDARVGQRRRRDARRARRRLAHGVRADDEPARAASSSSTNTHYANPIGLDAPGNYSSARDLARLAVRLREHSFIRKIADRTSATLEHRRPAAHDPQPQHAAREGPRRQRPQDRPHVGGRLRAGRHAHAPRRHARLRRARHAVAGRARPRRARAAAAGAPAATSAIQPVTRGAASSATPEIRYRRGAQLPLVTEGSVKRIVRAGARRSRSTTSACPKRSPARSGAASTSATARCSPTASGSRPCRSSSSASVPAADLPQRTKDWFTRPLALLLAALVLGGTVLVARRLRRGRRAAAPSARSRRPHDPHRHAQHGDRQDARGAELPARPPPPHRRADDDAGRQGRQRRARAQDARRARDRDRARRRRDRHAPRRAAHAALRAVRLRPHPRGVAHEHGGDRPDDGRADRDQRARAGGLRAGDRAVRRQAALPRARAPRCACSPARSRATSTSTSTPG